MNQNTIFKSTFALLITLSASSLFAQNPPTGTWNLSSTSTTSDQAVGIGTTAPRGWQEILYCPPLNQDHNGLVVTKFNCTQQSLGTTGVDVIGGGIVEFQGHDNGEGNNNNNNVFKVPFSYLTGFSTSPITPLYSSSKPLLWARIEKPPLGTTGVANDPANTFDTKFIVLPDGSCGINITKPRAALDVRGSNGTNRPAAIIGARAIGTSVSANGLDQFATQHIEFIPKLSENGYNQITQNNDQGIFFTDGKGTDGANENGALIIAPWAANQNSDIGGLRIDQSGNLEVHGNTLSVEVITQPKWWADYVFDEDYQLPSLGEMEKYIEKHKHLPNSPSESEIMESGLNVSDMMARQQQTIEELALHTINQQKEIEALKKLVEMLYEKLHY
jgi:hypothetical protein